MKIFLLLLFSSLSASHLCPNKHYWNKSLEKCLECRTCKVILIPCTEKINTICAENNHHFQKNRIHYIDKTDEEDINDQIHSKNYINNDELYFPFEKEHNKKYIKKFKPKHEEKHHHKVKKHFEFLDDDSDETYNDDDDDDETYWDYDVFERPKSKKHKKHFEFKKHEKKQDDFSLPEDYENDKHSSSDKGKKEHHKVTHLKKVNSDEEKLEEWLIQSRKKLKLRKDDLLKTLKGESGENKNDKKTIRLNSPVFESDSDNIIVNNKKPSGADGNNIKNYDKELESLMKKDNNYKVAKPAHRLYLGEPSTVSEIIGQVKDPQDVIRDEMGKYPVYEKPRFNVIPYVASKEQQSGGDVVSLPFTAAETLVWDWQAVAVVSAIASCLVFFSVVAIYFVINARQWKKVNKNYNKEIEEMSTRIALMHPTLDHSPNDSHTTSLYPENIGHGKEENLKGTEHFK